MFVEIKAHNKGYYLHFTLIIFKNIYTNKGSNNGNLLSCTCIQINFKPFQQVALKFDYF